MRENLERFKNVEVLFDQCTVALWKGATVHRGIPLHFQEHGRYETLPWFQCWEWCRMICVKLKTGMTCHLRTWDSGYSLCPHTRSWFTHWPLPDLNTFSIDHSLNITVWDHAGLPWSLHANTQSVFSDSQNEWMCSVDIGIGLTCSFFWQIWV